MIPELFRIPVLDWGVPGYGFALMVGFMLAIFWALHRASRSQADPDVILNIGFIAIIGGVVGARLMYIIHRWDQFSRQSLWTWVDVRQGGLEYYGGFLTAVIATALYLIIWRHSLRWYMDIVAPSVALGLAFGRVGCFLNGCCWGGVCEQPWAVRFPFGSHPSREHWAQREPGAGLPDELLFVDPDSGVTQPVILAPPATIEEQDRQLAGLVQQRNALAVRLEQTGDEAVRSAARAEMSKLQKQIDQIRSKNVSMRVQLERYQMEPADLYALARKHWSLPVHPTQLYSTVTALGIAAFLGVYYWRRRRDGQVICLLLVLEPIARFIIELIRVDNPLDTFGLTVSQFLAVAQISVGLLGLAIVQTLPPRSPSARLYVPPPPEAEAEAA